MDARAFAFSLLGPFESWMTFTNGFYPSDEDEIGGPMWHQQLVSLECAGGDLRVGLTSHFWIIFWNQRRGRRQKAPSLF